jgi:hypothetical protein
LHRRYEAPAQAPKVPCAPARSGETASAAGWTGRRNRRSGYLAVAATLLLALSAAHPATVRAAGGSSISLAGPLTNVSPCTTYHYSVKVISAKTYQEAYLSVKVPTGRASVESKRLRLTAHRTTTVPIDVTFGTTLGRGTTSREILLGVLVLPPHQGYKPLTHTHYTVQLAPTDVNSPPASCDGVVPPSFGS